MIQFYCPDINERCVLPESDSGHAVRVLRMREGDPLQVIDGSGGVYDCVLTAAHPKRATFEVTARREQPNPWQGKITICVAPTKNMDRMEWLTEKLTEIGVDRIIPVRCDRSERKELKRERLEKVAVAAMKQSLKAVLPEVTEMMPLRDALALIEREGVAERFVAYCDDYYPRVELAARCVPGADTAILIGPEGDFSPAEIKMAVDAGFTPVTLGLNRLRTETAALVAVDTLHIIAQAQCTRTK
ncbi:MAG: 16S rRNA (uracil(1498)-N(3))-methyltransferase [Candidatus Amulumruptor caecigallinarius]|nr:16S rRNA (uracil(1498)-N(3))-methyltransferase [Candidatus Amulumruptor caecigallinarius]MCM1396273.1 16S rRNA (uracil(1498)-N(3))-methyltransferase [Candidatus Amulumruptor caecigallinarius]MCM1454267.1 16S rRNA (uracil(1498)-N(3))-methyltransferase [bacterium]